MVIKLFGGIAVALVGIWMFMQVIYYGWVSSFPDVTPARYTHDQILSVAWAIAGLCFVLLGGALAVTAIRKMNSDYKKRKAAIRTGSQLAAND